MRRVGVLISGRGSNLQALLDAARAGALGGEVVAVVSNVPEARGLERARQAGVPAFVQDHRGRTRDEHDAAVQRILAEQGVELVCLAGYMRLLSAGFVRAHAERILNVHPSLLPAFPGLEAQQQAWEHGVKVTGATVHFVDEALDTGPIVLQEAVSVRATDTPATLSARILEAEHRIYPRAARIVLEGRYRRVDRRIVVEEGEGA